MWSYITFLLILLFAGWNLFTLSASIFVSRTEINISKLAQCITSKSHFCLRAGKYVLVSSWFTLGKPANDVPGMSLGCGVTHDCTTSIAIYTFIVDILSIAFLCTVNVLVLPSHSTWLLLYCVRLQFLLLYCGNLIHTVLSINHPVPTLLHSRQCLTECAFIALSLFPSLSFGILFCTASAAFSDRTEYS